MNYINKDAVLENIFNEAQVISKEIKYDPYVEQEHYNYHMSPHTYCESLATEIFVNNDEYDPRIEVFNRSVTNSMVEWYHRFSIYKAIIKHPNGAAGVYFDSTLGALNELDKKLSSINKQYLKLSRNQVNMMNPDDITILIGRGEELMNKLANFMELVDLLIVELEYFGEQEVTYN